MARTRRGRLKQVEAWLRKNYPTALPVTVRVWDMLHTRKCIAECTQDGRRLIISIHKNVKWEAAIDCLLHEWGHAVVWKSKDPLPHGPEFSAAYGKIYCDWCDLDGAEDSRTP